MPINPYSRKVSLRRPHRKGDLDIVRASYTRRKANVTKALVLTVVILSKNIFSEPDSFMHMFNVSTLYRQSIKLLHQKLW